MKSENNTILITGGGSGIGFETAKLFAEKGNKVIIAGRNLEKLEAAVAQLNNVTAIQCDVTSESDVNDLVQRINSEFPDLNVLINNSGSVFGYSLEEGADAYTSAQKEIDVNYLAPVRLTEKLLPVLKKQADAAIINITSIVAIIPWAFWPTYSASKVALQAYTRLLRLSLSDSAVKVFEIAPPLTDTEFSEKANGNKTAPKDVADAIFYGFTADQLEVRIGYSEMFYGLNQQSPEKAFNTFNGVA